MLASTSAPATRSGPFPPGGPAPERGAAAAVEAVEVRCRRVGRLEEPEQLLWRGRLWVVRHAEHVTSGRPGAGPTEGDERWRVQVGDGMGGRRLVLELTRRTGGPWLLLEETA